MNEKKWKESQKKLVKQRDEARALVEKLPSVEAALVEMTSARDGLRAEIGRLEDKLDLLLTEKEMVEQQYTKLVKLNSQSIEDATDGFRKLLAQKEAELTSLKMEEVKTLRRRLQGKTEKEAEYQKQLNEMNKFCNHLLRIPGVREHLAEAKQRAEAAAVAAKAKGYAPPTTLAVHAPPGAPEQGGINAEVTHES